MIPEGVLAEDKVGEVEGQTGRLSDTDLQHGDKICFILALKEHFPAECLRFAQLINEMKLLPCR